MQVVMQSVRRSSRRATGGAASFGDAVTSTEQEGDPLADKEYDGALLHSSSPSVSAASSDNELAEMQPALAGAAASGRGRGGRD